MMPWYVVYFEGEISIEAENEEAAKREAWTQLEGDVTITGVEKEDE